MSEFPFPFLQLSVITPLLGALAVGRLKDRDAARKWCAWFSAVTLVFTLGAWQSFVMLGATEARDTWDASLRLLGTPFLSLDELCAPLLPLVALLYLLTAIATLRTKIRRFSFAGTLAREALVLATFACRQPWGIIMLLALGVLPAWYELRVRGKPTRVFVWHMAAFVALMVVGWSLVQWEGDEGPHSLWAVLPLLLAVLIRCGIAPFHCWVTDLFEHKTFGTAILFVTPMTGAYAAVRLLLPIVSDGVLHSVGMLSLATAVYAAGMSLVQREARRFFCYLFLSHSALVLAGLEIATPIGLTGALCVWLSVGLSQAGFGLTLRALEARHGRLSLIEFRGLYEHTPTLAICFLLTGLASVGFPGTFGFVGTELVVDGAVHAYPYLGLVLVVASALNGIAVVKAYFLLFTGTRHATTVPLGIGLRERFAVLTLAALILGGGLFPQPGVASRYHAAEQILQARALHMPAANVVTDASIWDAASKHE
jgi:NADH-quinone oxidoreductase subunit M